MEIILLRHGESDANHAGIVQGRGDYPLSERGRNQALLTAQRLAVFRPYRIYSSPLARARQTAEIVNRPHNVEVLVLEDLIEYNLGAFEGLRFREVLERYPEVEPGLKRGIPFHHLAPGAENDEEADRRAERALRAILDSGLPRVVVVSHLGILERIFRAATASPRSSPPEAAFPLRNCSLTHLDINPREVQVLSLNETSHLD